jgi:ABC-type multidrug transport system ATPase subunit
VSFAARPGEITMVLGVSGSGKTTLLKLFKGLLAPRQGSVRVLGASVVSARRAGWITASRTFHSTSGSFGR